MDKPISIQNKYCVLIPTYNNETTLKKVIEDALTYSKNIIIVNDGSTDSTPSILEEFSYLSIVNFSKNEGKGIALRKGFDKAVELGFTHAITMDSDGQHLAKDIPNLITLAEKDNRALIIGARNMNQENVPDTSSFGHKFSNFWFKFETGIDAPDTQSGFRLYPVHLLKDFRFYTSKFEFEIEVIVRSAWKDIPILFAPIDVYYPPQDERVTHFRKIPDFTRISILNTVLVTLAIFYYKPRNFFRDLKKKSAKEFIKKYIVDSNEPTHKIVLAVFLGIFIGLSPLHGFKLMLIVSMAVGLKLNKALSIGVSYVSGIPPIIPLLIFVSHEIGALILQNDNHLLFAHRHELNLKFVAENILQQYLGGLLFATIGASLVALITYLTLVFYKNKRRTNG